MLNQIGIGCRVEQETFGAEDASFERKHSVFQKTGSVIVRYLAALRALRGK